MRKKITILSVVAVLSVLIIASMPVSLGGPPPECTVKLGNVYFINAVATNDINATKSGSVSDVFYNTAWLKETRQKHSQYTIHETVIRAPKTLKAMVTVHEDQQWPGGEIWYIGVKYYIPGERTLVTSVYTSENPDPDTQTTIITITGRASTDWDFVTISDFTEYSDSTLDIEFSDGDYEHTDVPDAGDTTIIETEHGHEVEYTTDADNEILYITVRDADTVNSEVTLSLA